MNRVAAKEQVLEACRGDLEQAAACWAAAGIPDDDYDVTPAQVADAVAGRPFYPDEP